MKLTYDGGFGPTGDDVRGFAQTPHPVSGVMYAQPIGSLDSNALREEFAHMARWKQAAFAQAAYAWDRDTPGLPNPWLGENTIFPAPGQPHPAK